MKPQFKVLRFKLFQTSLLFLSHAEQSLTAEYKDVIVMSYINLKNSALSFIVIKYTSKY